jgi:hypothetical protein
VASPSGNVDAIGATAVRVARGLHRRLPPRAQDLSARLWHAVHPPDPAAANDAFLHLVYQRLLGRDIDESGLRTFRWRMAQGFTPAEVAMELAESAEFATRLQHRVISVAGHVGISDLTQVRPDSYELSADSAQRRLLTYEVRSDDDFDWLERQIIDHDYYERPGVWILDIDLDKRVMAEVMALFQPSLALEVGCSSGAVMTCLDDLGIVADGIDISESSRALASPRIRQRIVVGDILELGSSRRYDLVYGLDIFEHLNPNKLDDYLSALVANLSDGGFMFANIPAYGDDSVFGVVNVIALPDWEDPGGDGLFRRLPVDDAGYPLHGHLIWATTEWWTARFESFGVRREPDVEQAIHRRYDAYLRAASPARVSFYVFGKSVDPAVVADLVARIDAGVSTVLEVVKA